MNRFLCLLLALLAPQAALPVRALEPINDETLAAVSGGDGVSFAVRLRLNDPNNANPVTDSRLTAGFNVGGQQQHLVVKNLRGSIDMFALHMDIGQRSDGGGDYLAITLPGYLHFGKFGFESISAETDPRGAITGNLGRFEIDGLLSMRGQVRMWTQ